MCIALHFYALSDYGYSIRCPQWPRLPERGGLRCYRPFIDEETRLVCSWSIGLGHLLDLTEATAW